MQTVNIYIHTDIKGPGTKAAGTYIYVLEMATGKGTLKGIKTLHEVTGNKLQLVALIDALARFNKSCNINIHINSPYVSGTVENERILTWRANGWKTSRGEDVANKKEWTDLHLALARHEWKFHKLSEDMKNTLEKEMYR